VIYDGAMGVAIIFAVSVAVGLAAYVGWAVYAVSHGAALWPFVIGAPFVYLAVPLFFTTQWMLLGWLWRSPRPREVQISFAQTVRYFWKEYLSIAQAPKMIFYALLMRDPKPAPASLPVLLLHGIGCNAAVWTSMRRYLEREGLGPVYALSYGPPFAAIEFFAPQVAQKIAQIERDTGASQVVVVGHSMGGLVARTYIRRYGGAHVRRLITLGTPHAGSRHAYLMSGESLVEMRPGSAYLAALARRDGNEAGVPIVSLWSWHDSMVTPQLSSQLDWTQNIVIRGVAHNALLGNPAVQRYVADEIRRARAGAPTNVFPASAARTPSVPV
jgi:triacylglycerol esterase/lipase EstA (alpha/beta hydrolase family)